LASRKLQDETELVKSVDEIKLLGKDLNEIGSIVKDLGENLTGHVARDIRKMLKVHEFYKETKLSLPGCSSRFYF